MSVRSSTVFIILRFILLRICISSCRASGSVESKCVLVQESFFVFLSSISLICRTSSPLSLINSQNGLSRHVNCFVNSCQEKRIFLLAVLHILNQIDSNYIAIRNTSYVYIAYSSRDTSLSPSKYMELESTVPVLYSTL